MNFLFAWRYFRSKKSTNAINVIAWISVTAITVGCAALIIILSVFNGFEELVKGLYTDFYTDIRIAPAKGKIITLNTQQQQQIKSTPGVAVFSLVAEEKALLVNGPYQSIVLVKGVDEQYVATNKIADHIKRGKFALGTLETPSIVLGYGIENAIGADVERGIYPLTLYTPNRKASFNSMDGLSVNNITASGTFQVQQEFDNKYAFTNLAFFCYMLNMEAYTLHSIRSQMGIVTQEPILFNDTIANNIALGIDHADQRQIEQAAKVANAYDFIQRKEEGFDTNIGDRGTKLSGGERQRVTIARAVLKNPPILILDEATSSLDTESERLVQDAINNMMQQRTSIVIAHRLSTIRNADEIIVLQKGEIAERGTHDELLLRGGIYKKLVEMQEVR